MGSRRVHRSLVRGSEPEPQLSCLKPQVPRSPWLDPAVLPARERRIPTLLGARTLPPAAKTVVTDTPGSACCARVTRVGGGH